VLGAPDLRPIEWRVWAGEAEKDERRLPGKRTFEAGEGGGVVGNPFRFLEGGERRGFWDGRTVRREFAKWVRDGSKGDAQVGKDGIE
jgi:membrane magnesium transporter 1